MHIMEPLYHIYVNTTIMIVYYDSLYIAVFNSLFLGGAFQAKGTEYFLFVDYLTGLYPYFTILCHT